MYLIGRNIYVKEKKKKGESRSEAHEKGQPMTLYTSSISHRDLHHIFQSR